MLYKGDNLIINVRIIISTIIVYLCVLCSFVVQNIKPSYKRGKQFGVFHGFGLSLPAPNKNIGV